MTAHAISNRPRVTTHCKQPIRDWYLARGAFSHDWGTVGLNDSQASQTLMFHINANDFVTVLTTPLFSSGEVPKKRPDDRMWQNVATVLFESCKHPNTQNTLLDHWKSLPNNTNPQENVGKQIQEAWPSNNKMIDLKDILPHLSRYLQYQSKNRTSIMEGFGTKYGQSSSSKNVGDKKQKTKKAPISKHGMMAEPPMLFPS
jgi:hypothetical protein